MTTPYKILEEAAIHLASPLRQWRQSLDKKPGVTITDCLIHGYYKVCPPLFESFKKPNGEALTFGDISADRDVLRERLFKHEMPLYGAKCLLARADESILVDDTKGSNGFLFPCYINLQEWNDRKDQTRENILKVLNIALDLAK